MNARHMCALAAWTKDIGATRYPIDSYLQRLRAHRTATYIATYTRRRRGIETEKEKKKTERRGREEKRGREPASRPRGTAGGKTGCARGRDREDQWACRPTGLRLNLMRGLHAYTAALPLVGVFILMDTQSSNFTHFTDYLENNVNYLRQMLQKD